MQNAEEVSQGVRNVIISESEDGQRVDNYLLAQSPGVPKSHVYRIIRSGEVRVNGGRTKPMKRLHAGDKVRIPPLRLKPTGPVTVPSSLASALRKAVIFEQDDFFVVSKPPGLAVHKGSGLAFGAIDALRQEFDNPELELVHRIDRGTSGALLIARDRGRCRQLQALFRNQAVIKHYKALVVGLWPEASVTIDAPLKKNVETAGERRVQVDPDGQSAVSHFSVTTRFREATELLVRIETGRTHQIRVHARHHGYPLVGDTRYGDKAANRTFKQRGLARLFLHSSSLEFDWAGVRQLIEAPVDEHWQHAVARLSKVSCGR